MVIKRWLNQNQIHMDLEAVSRREVLERMVLALPNKMLTRAQKAKALDLLFLRERMGTTAIGQNIAFPHCFSSHVTTPIVAFGVSRDGIDFSSLDDSPVHFVFLLILPKTTEAQHLKRNILQSVKWFLSDRFLQSRLKSADTSREVYNMLIHEMPVQLSGFSSILN